MIKELRLGNWIQGVSEWKGNERYDIPMFIEGIFTDSIYANFEGNESDVWEYNEGEFEGIPLTEEIIKKCGGSYTVTGNFFIPLLNEGEGVVISEALCYIYCHGDMAEIAPIRYMHQLQNLYFCLTGKELTNTL